MLHLILQWLCLLFLNVLIQGGFLLAADPETSPFGFEEKASFHVVLGLGVVDTGPDDGVVASFKKSATVMDCSVSFTGSFAWISVTKNAMLFCVLGDNE